MEGTCDLCSAENIRIFDIANTNLQNAFETITEVPIESSPYYVCFICRRKIQKCLKLLIFARQSQGIRKAILSNRNNERVVKQKKFVRSPFTLSKAVAGTVSIPPKSECVQIKTEIKKDPDNNDCD